MVTNNSWNSQDPAQVAKGGTGAATLTGVLTGNGTSAVTANAVTEYGVLVGGASNAVASTAVGTAAQVLTSNGAGVAPTYQTPTVGTVTSVSGTANRISSTGGATPVINIDTAYVGQATITTLGTVTTGTWTGTDIAVADGGTGRSSHTAYAVLCGGTTTTAAQQSIASVGTAAQVLTSNGAGALPTFQASPANVWTLISAQTPSAASTVEFVDAIDTNGTYFLSIVLSPATSGVDLHLEMSADSGVTWLSTGYLSSLIYNEYTSATISNTNSTSEFIIGDTLRTQSNGYFGSFYIQRTGAGISQIHGNCTWREAIGPTLVRAGRFNGLMTTSAIDSFRILPSADEITGRIELYSIANS